MALKVIFQNLGTGTEDAANYRVDVLVNDHRIATEYVEGHRRGAGWRALITRYAADCQKLEPRVDGDAPREP